MITLSFGDFAVLFLMNLIVSYIVTYTKRSTELFAEKGSRVPILDFMTISHRFGLTYLLLPKKLLKVG